MREGVLRLKNKKKGGKPGKVKIPSQPVMVPPSNKISTVATVVVGYTRHLAVTTIILLFTTWA